MVVAKRQNNIIREAQKRAKKLLVFSALTSAALLIGTITTTTLLMRNVLEGSVKAHIAVTEGNLLSNQELDALVSGLQAGKTLHHPLLRLWNPSSQLIEKTKGVLYKAVYSVRENNA